jgi:hypothetical protein
LNLLCFTSYSDVAKVSESQKDIDGCFSCKFSCANIAIANPDWKFSDPEFIFATSYSKNRSWFFTFCWFGVELPTGRQNALKDISPTCLIEDEGCDW